MKTFASLFTGGDLAGEGARMAGLTPIWGVESDPDIAAVAELNGTRIVVSKVEENADFSQLETPDWLHMSPPCINASVAKTDAGEAPEDIEMAQGCIRAIRHFKSLVVSLENVWGYRNFESFQMIYAQLMSLGYQTRFWHLCAADYGVAQTRKRLILVASLKGTPKRPEQTHSQDGHVGFFETMPRWIGWYEAIEDLIPTLPESAFAEWQLSRLENLNDDGQSFLARSTDSKLNEKDIHHFTDDPFSTITTAGVPKAFLVHNNDQRTMPVRDGDDPAFTVMAGGNNSHDPGIKPKAFIASCHQSEGAELTLPIREANKPAVSIGCHSAGHHKAFLMPGGNSSSAEPREPREPSMTIGDTERVGNIPRVFLARINGEGSEPLDVAQPSATITGSHNVHRAFIVDGKPANYAGDLRIVGAEDPSPTATATATANQHPMRAWLSQGKVVALTVRALARLQSIPDSYQLPEKNSLACRIVGNAVPPLLMKAIIEAQK